jgi:hypothetical protein
MRFRRADSLLTEIAAAVSRSRRCSASIWPLALQQAGNKRDCVAATQVFAARANPFQTLARIGRLARVGEIRTALLNLSQAPLLRNLSRLPPGFLPCPLVRRPGSDRQRSHQGGTQRYSAEDPKRGAARHVCGGIEIECIESIGAHENLPCRVLQCNCGRCRAPTRRLTRDAGLRRGVPTATRWLL